LKGKKILLGITGSIAAFKACDIIRYLRDCGSQVRVVLTQGSENFVTKTTLETLSGFPVLSGFWTEESPNGTYHIDTARWADLVLVAPATAHFIGKMANGLADDLLSTEILAFQGPVLVAPAMNPAMFAHPAVQENIQRLKSRGVQILGPTSGLTSCGEEGLGRMIEPDQIVQNVAAAFFEKKSAVVGRAGQINGLAEERVIVTLGPTRSPIDPVRYISNRSSGLMGASLCWAAVEKGYQVTAICGPTDVELPNGIEVIRVTTAREMLDASLKKWEMAKIFIASAAVLDWDVKNPATNKLKKESGTPEIELAKNPDILAEVSRLKNSSQFVLGFAAETENPTQNGIIKLRQKGCDAIFVNDVSQPNQGFESSFNGGWWMSSPDKVEHLDACPKSELARKLFAKISSQITPGMTFKK
jgi:phosphopantothenoylcysteine decarboxylase/phosphopantothenate--cysteine ligase